MSNHHLNNTGQSVICTAPPSAQCHRRPACDAETWNNTGCNDHGGLHPVGDSPDCWQSEYLNALDLSETYGDWDCEPVLLPNAAIDVKFVGVDEGCCWEYAEVAA